MLNSEVFLKNTIEFRLVEGQFCTRMLKNYPVKRLLNFFTIGVQKSINVLN